MKLKMKDIISDVDTIVSKKVEEYIKTRIPFADNHHAFAIAYEEFEEVESDVRSLGTLLNGAWYSCKIDDEKTFREIINEIKKVAEHCSGECIQLASVCEKYERSKK